MKKDKAKSFELEFNRLSEIVSKLESEETELEGALKLYEEGAEKIKSCDKYLNEAESKIKKIKQSREKEQVNQGDSDSNDRNLI
ncbi:MAG: exodeoxyribonuclease VII small subunit [Nitrospinota bacterium]